MGILDRIILSIYTFLLTFLSLLVLLLAFNLVPANMIDMILNHIVGQWEVGIVGAVFLLVSIRLLLAGLRSDSRKETIIHHADMGDVHITIDAVENLIEKTARQVHGVRGAKVKAACSDKGLRVKIRAIISPGSSIPEVGTEMQQRIHEYVGRTVGVDIAEIKILVNNISNEFKTKQRVE